MRNEIHILLPLILIAGLFSCARPNYIQPINDSVATVSFSNLSDELAEIYIVTNDK